MQAYKKEEKMSELRKKYYRVLFLIAAAYDIFLGIVFMFFYKSAFKLLGISQALPEFGGYLSLIGAFLFVIGIAYYLIYRGDLVKNRDLILIGALYKLAYCAVAFFYFAIGEIPHMLFIGLFGVVDFIMFVLIVECLVFIGKIDRDALTV
jgi:hypothetical protein